MIGVEITQYKIEEAKSNINASNKQTGYNVEYTTAVSLLNSHAVSRVPR